MLKDVRPGYLLDFYGPLLTEKQRQFLDLYYNQDYSLAEIAEQEGISRQAVRDSIKRGEGQLREMEQSLGMMSRYLEVTERLGRLKTDLESLPIPAQSQAQLQLALEELEGIRSLWEDTHGI
jgi:predicted DNA-binding protein YlxM (UPF0122 family)